MGLFLLLTFGSRLFSSVRRLQPRRNRRNYWTHAVASIYSCKTESEFSRMHMPFWLLQTEPEPAEILGLPSQHSLCLTQLVVNTCQVTSQFVWCHVAVALYWVLRVQFTSCKLKFLVSSTNKLNQNDAC
jgi:hypothetical protein